MDNKELTSLLFSAIQHHNESLLDDLLNSNDALNLLDLPGEDGNTLLHVAIIENDLNCLICLLKHGADPNVFDSTRARSPLHLAVELGQTEAVETMLDLQHVNLDLRDDRNLTCYEIALFCDNQDLAELINRRKQDYEKFKDDFYNVMNQACSNNEPRLVRELFERFERKIINNLPKGWQPYKDKRAYSRSMLKELINWSSSSWNDVTLLFKSASKGHTEVCKLLIDFGATAKCNESTNYSPLYVAAYGGHTNTVRLLLDSFPSLIQEITIEKWTVLHACCLQGHSETAKLVLNYPYPESLLRKFTSRSGLYEYKFSFNPNAQDAAGQTVIYLAVAANNETLLDTLLTFNVEANLLSTSQSPSDSTDQKLSKNVVGRRTARDVSIKPCDQQVSRQSRIVSDQPRARQNIAETSRLSRFNPSNQIDKIMRQLLKMQFSKENENSDQICVTDSESDKYLICPFEMDAYCDYNSKTALHLAVCQQYHNIATTLLVNGSNPNLPILFRDSARSDSISNVYNGNETSSTTGLNSIGDVGLNWLRSSKSTCLREACRLNDETMCAILIRYGARDNQENLALQVATANKNNNLISMFLSLKSNVDPEFKINRKCNVEFASRYRQGQRISKSGQETTTFSSMFPSAPVTIDWKNLKSIQQIDPQWLIDASLAHNKRLRHPTNSLMAITRLDLSSNNLSNVHPVIFRLPSLRELDLSCNRLKSLMDLTNQLKLAYDREPVTPTSRLIESQRIAMKRSKSSHFTGSASLEYSNLIDLNEPQDWDLPFLEVFDLHDNLLISLPDCLFDLPKLVELDVSSNQLRQLPWAIWTAPNLKELNLSDNLLDDLPKAPPRPATSGFNQSLDVFSANSSISSQPNNTSSTNQTFERLDTSSFMTSIELETSKESTYLQLLRDSQSLTEKKLALKPDKIIHLNQWSKYIDLTEDCNLRQKDTTSAYGLKSGELSISKLNHLNLSQNSFTSIPPVLACIATQLTRLNLSYNRLHSLGDLSLYPYKLKNLDLSSNQINSWFKFNQLDDDTKHCYNDYSSRQVGSQSIHCIHKQHQRLDNLKSINLSHNQLKDIQLFHPGSMHVNQPTSRQHSDRSSNSAYRGGYSLLYPNITALDVSSNHIVKVPEGLNQLVDLSVLNLSGNVSISTLPPELGFATKLWNLGVTGCSLSEPLKSIVESKSYKTLDIIGYLRSILEESKPYARMKLMLVGLQGIGKTSLLEQMRHEGSSGFMRRAPEHWTKRMGHSSRNNLRNQKGVTLSTVGVDIHDWVYQRRAAKNQPSFGPVSFSTWDFGGQEEFYATHRYFLSRRSMYLVVWRLTDGLCGIHGIQQWLVNIQSRAPGSPVIIVGTHEDLIEGGERGEIVQRLQAEVHRRFIDLSDHDKCGLPRIMDSIVVSTRTKLNVKNLCNRIYDVVFSLRCPGTTERLLEQKIPATYLYLEEIVSWIVHERHQKKREPVLTYDEYRRTTSEQLKLKYNKTFRDLELLNSREINYNSELQQATRFLHENGVLLHYEDSNLRDLYFLDPQWLCDILSHVVTIREINPYVKNGLMRIDDLGHLFKSIDINLSGGVQSYVVNLLNKFEVALTWNSQYLLIPSLLPDHPNCLNNKDDFQVKLAPRVRGRSVARRHEVSSRIQANRATSIDPINKQSAKQLHRSNAALKNLFEFICQPEKSIVRLILLRYLPAGFLARLQSSILSDPAFEDICEDLHLDLVQKVMDDGKSHEEFTDSIGSRPGWSCWKSGIRLTLEKESTINTKGDHNLLTPNLLTVQELSPDAKNFLQNKLHFKIECSRVNEDEQTHLAKIQNEWIDLDMNQYSNIIAITVPNPRLSVNHNKGQDKEPIYENYNLDHLIVARLLSKAVDHIDDLLEDWYPSLGARFAHTLGGNYLVTRIVPCQNCLNLPTLYRTLDLKLSNQIETRASRSSNRSLTNNPIANRDIKFSMKSARDPPNLNRFISNQTGSSLDTTDFIHCYYVEHCILSAYDSTPTEAERRVKFVGANRLSIPGQSAQVADLFCPKHGNVSINATAPDLIFDDVLESFKISNDQIERCKLIGRGALGFVFKGSLLSKFPYNQLSHANHEVALKLLQPVDPGPEADQADLVAYNSAKSNWIREPFQSACKSYCTARHEVNILQTISHPNIVSFIGLCLRPLAIVLELAPLGSLAEVFKNYKRACLRIDQYTAQKSILQVAKALEFLHQQRVIYRDLKTENILVWSFPSPFATCHQSAQVELKLADYGISRQALSTGIWKGFAGTMSYLAPEILRHNGDEEYTEKVDCFSFGMFMYELLTLRPPYKQMVEVGGKANFGAPRSQLSSMENARPSLTQRDLVYPCLMLDLMSLCWSQEPHDRPTASQIVSIASTPEFMQIHDALLLDSTNLDPKSEQGPQHFSIGTFIQVDQNPIVSFVDSANQLNILFTNCDQWSSYRSSNLNNLTRSPITCMCLVDNKIWFCDSEANVFITDARFDKSRVVGERIDQVSNTPNITFGQDNSSLEVDFQTFRLIERNGKSVRLGHAKSMIYADQAKAVVFLTVEGLLWICKLDNMTCEQLEDSSIRYNCMALLASNDKSILPISPAPSNDSAATDSLNSIQLAPTISNSFQIYCGQTNGISCLEICDAEVRRQSILPLANNGAHGSQDESIDDSPTGAEICHIVTNGNEDFLWTSAQCTVHLWSIKGRHVVRRLDCWKLVPCSESLDSINIESYYQQARTSQVTSLVYKQNQLFVGTSHGCFIVIEATTLKPLTVFRPFESMAFVSKPIQVGSAIRNSHNDQNHQLIALGLGYRDLIRRYLMSGNLLDAQELSESASKTSIRQAHQSKLTAILLSTFSQYNL